RRGNIVWEAQHRTRGGIRAEAGSGADIPFRFLGQYADSEIGLLYSRFRYYDPDLFRYTTPDPIGLDGGMQLHNYVPTPVAWTDPYGLQCKIHSVEELLPG